VSKTYDGDDADDNQSPHRMRFPRTTPTGLPAADRRVVLIVFGTLVFAWRALDGTYTLHNQGVSNAFARQLGRGEVPTVPRLTVSPGITTMYL
jgi:hypothetical protein